MNRSADLIFWFVSKLFAVNVQNYYILEFPFFKFLLGSCAIFLDVKT